VRPSQASPASARPCLPAPKVGFGSAALLVALAVLALTASPALGNNHVFTTSFGSATSTPVNPYPLSGPTDVAVDLSSHDVYVTDAINHRVEKFDASGHLVLMFGKGVNKTQIQAGSAEAQQNVCVPSVDECQAGAASATSSPGSLNTPAFIDVDNSGGPSAGDVYVADLLGKGIVTKFDSTGHLITSWGTGGQFVRTDGINGIAVNPTGVLIVMGTDFPFGVARYSENGTPIGAFSNFGFGLEQQGIAVDARERFYRGGNAEVPRASAFNEAGAVAENIASGTVTGVEIDPMSNDLYVDDHGTFINHFKLQCGENCTPLETFGNGKLSGARGISVDAPSDNVYVANTGGNDVVVFDGTAPYATTGPASSVGHTTATMTGHLAEGGRGAVTGCHFEYGPGESYEGGPVPCVPAPPYGSEADVTAELTGLQPETTYHYRLVASNSSDTAIGADRTFTPHYVLGVATEPATNVGKESAELNGSYVGDGTATTYHFEYGPKATYEDSTPEHSGGSGVGPQSVTPALIEGLQPHTTYHYRLVANNTLGTTYGQNLTLTTPDRPGLGRMRSSHVTATTAELLAQIDPRGADTVFHFEYGTSIDYGSKIPIPDEDIGSSSGMQEVSVALSNLEVGATYHFRVVAENAFGKTVSEDQDFSFYPPACPNATVRQETSSNYLPDCRGYELVSPAEAGSVSLYPVGPSSATAIDPARLAFGGWLNSIQGANQPVNVWGDLYVATRTATGWVTKYVGLSGTQTNNASGPPGESTNAGFFTPPIGTRSDSTLSTFLDWNNENFGFTSINPPPNFTPYVWAADGSSLGEWPTATGHPPGPTLNESPDLSHYYFISGGAVTERGGEYLQNFLYEGGTAYDNNIKAGTVTPIAFDSGGTPIEVKGVPQSSTDGSRILMSTAPCGTQAVSSCSPGELYMRVNDAMTYDIAKGHAVQYLGMTADASKVYFSSAEQLTATDHDTSTDLYLWTEEGNALTLVSVGNGGAGGNTDECSPGWIEMCGVMPIVNNFYSQTFRHGGMFGNGLTDNSIGSKSGDIYFFSPERLDGKKGFRNQPNLYVYRDGALQYVTTLEPGGGCESEGQLGHGCSQSPIARIQVSPDGAYMAFTTSSKVTAYENALRSEMYNYSPASGEIVCVSCIPSGATPTSDVWASSDGVFMTNDGRTFFSTKDALVPRDTDGLRDVYEYVAGRAQLISSGTSGKGSQTVLGFEIPLFTAGLAGVSADGVNAYFTTFSSLVPQDHNGNFLKFYDARTNGGFHYVAPLAPCEAADECAGSGSPPPTVPPNRGGVDLGSGGNVSPRHKGHHHRKKTQHHKSRKHVGKSGRHGK
jgi:NHL repeat